MSTASTSTGATTTTPKVPRSRIPMVLTWADPVRSGMVFGELLLTLIVIRYGNLLRLTLKLCCYAIGATGIIEFATRYINGTRKGLISNYKPSRYISINQHSMEKYTNRTISWLSQGFAELKKLFDAEDLSLSLGAFFCALFMYVLTGFVSVSTLLFIAVVSAFSLPRLYLQFQSEIDGCVDMAHEEACKHYKNVSSQVHEAAGPHLANARKQVEGVASKVGFNISRGGFPSDAKEPVATSASEPVGTTTSAATATGSGSHKSEEPVTSLSEDQRTVGGVTYDSVPTIVGDVSLNEQPDYPNPSAATDNQPPTVDDTNVTSVSAQEMAHDLKTDVQDTVNPASTD